MIYKALGAVTGGIFHMFKIISRYLHFPRYTDRREKQRRDALETGLVEGRHRDDRCRAYHVAMPLKSHRQRHRQAPPLPRQNWSIFTSPLPSISQLFPSTMNANKLQKNHSIFLHFASKSKRTVLT